MATLKAWRLLRKLRCSPSRITELVRAVLALQLNILMDTQTPGDASEEAVLRGAHQIHRVPLNSAR